MILEQYEAGIVLTGTVWSRYSANRFRSEIFERRSV
jgi:tmRNA-binding protein